MSIDINDQYDKIFRYCYYKIRDRDIAEDLTQDTFLRFLESPHYRDIGKELHYLYTIAGNLCKDAFHRRTAEELDEKIADDKDYEDFILTNVALGNAIKNLPEEDKEIIILRYINDVPIGVLGELFGMSRFRMSRRIKGILRHLRQTLD
ncbi:RNA polymerase sigma factor [Ruminococcus flavefaciens]|uniref:RNA polymerase sigma-70 factor (ECF subfamily) n=1 Tax=Ruminococcus flavefaciens TaxID=1265 RepID=A0A315Y2M3_RUMFL|nr:sigma-70 family RNA polymerase sigma factor [Ruminococcus flavefaciens]PWJ14737.1 RNA polymerase sigma-70 factor (ECF subfamily) [Ruminococcus flavefaciens]SSA42767.1 RNA polymerase sigma-70 factor, ECF subfamily [Ruminococcus flavefaciens]